MRIDWLLATAAALVASTMVISCGDDNNVTPSNNPGNNPAITTVSVVKTAPEPAPVPGY